MSFSGSIEMCLYNYSASNHIVAQSAFWCIGTFAKQKFIDSIYLVDGVQPYIEVVTSKSESWKYNLCDSSA